MPISLSRKLRWFHRGAASFERTFPGLLAKRLGTGFGPAYVCPECDRAFSEDAVHEGSMTVEHVPPKSFGGRELLLTCRECNSRAGWYLDAHARRKEDCVDAMNGTSRRALKVRMKHGEHALNARLVASAKDWSLEVVERSNNPAAITAFKSSTPIRAGSPITVEFTGGQFAELAAKMSWLRAGFLAMFAAFGYRFTCDPAVRIVKQQLRSPDVRLIYCFTIEIPRSTAWAGWRILEIPEPVSTGVLFGRYVVLFPHAGDLTFYERLERQIVSEASRSSVRMNAQSYVLAGEPSFGYQGSE